jgi:LacI family transcriptional regulator
MLSFPDDPPMSVTMREVAREAGVSVATVSRVLNRSGPVGATTRERIEEVARTLRYVPNGAARSLTTARTHTLGVLLPDLYGEFFSEVLRGMDHAARSRGYHLLVSSAHDGPNEVEAALHAMSGRVDGLLVMMPVVERRVLERNLRPGFPTTLLNCAYEEPGADVIAVDNVGGARAMVRHLAEHGHSRIAFIAGAPGNHDAEERRQGYLAGLADGGLVAESRYELPGDFTQQAGYDAARGLVALAPTPTAVFAANDAMAVGALAAFAEMDVHVPGEIAIAGFDDIPMARYVRPALSTVHVGIGKMGARAVEMLLAAVEGGEHEPAVFRLPARLVLRGSCGCIAEPQS